MVLTMNTNAAYIVNPPAIAAVTVEISPDSKSTWNPFDPAWIKVWEQVGPIGYLALLCLFLWLLTRFVETVKGK